MPVRGIARRSTVSGSATPTHAPIYVDSDDNIVKIIKAGSGTTEVQIVDASSAQTITNKTLTSPTITGATLTTATLTSPVLNDATGTGQIITKSGILTENGAATSYTLTFTIPATAILHNIRVIAKALWNGTSASLKVGDTADDDGYFASVNVKATDLLVNEVLSAEDGDLWGGRNGAYLVAATGQRGPTTTNFGQYYEAGSNITAIVTPGAADGTLGRTVVEVEYSIPTAVAQVVV